MKIPVEKITEKGIRIDKEVSADSWNLDGFGIKFIGCVKLKGLLKREYNQIVSEVKIVTHRQINCSRCLAEVCQIKNYNFQKRYKLSDLDIFLDISQDLREEILLNFPLKVLCSSDCRGLCPCCGRNLNWGRCNCSKINPACRQAGGRQAIN